MPLTENLLINQIVVNHMYYDYKYIYVNTYGYIHIYMHIYI